MTQHQNLRGRQSGCPPAVLAGQRWYGDEVGENHDDSEPGGHGGGHAEEVGDGGHRNDHAVGVCRDGGGIVYFPPLLQIGIE